ncbi:hypothetical protein Tco_0595880 [Tanacetum coccineum]
MHIRNDPSFFLTNKTEAPRVRKWVFGSNNSSSRTVLIDKALHATGVAPGIKSIRNFTCWADGIPRSPWEILRENLNNQCINNEAKLYGLTIRETDHGSSSAEASLAPPESNQLGNIFSRAFSLVLTMPWKHEISTHKEEMDLETAQTTTTAKLPILKQGEYDMWRLRIEQYFQVQDYALWDVIENGNC